MASAGLAQGSRVAGPAAALLSVVALAGVGAIAVCTALTLSSDHLLDRGAQALMMDWIIFGYVFAGLIAWWRRPASRFGLLMIAAGFVMFLSSLSSANAPLPYTIGAAFDLIPAVLFLHVFLAFPTGRLVPRDKVLVIVGWAVGFGVHFAGMLFGGFGPDNLVEVTDSQDVSTELQRAQLIVLSLLMLAGIWVLLARRRRARRPLRHPLTLLVDSFALGLAMVAFLFTSAAIGLVNGQAEFEWIRRAAFFAIGLAPIAFVSGLLYARLARSSVGDLLVELRDDLEASDLRDALARALRDPTVELAYWLPEYRSWAGPDGKPVVLDRPDETRATTLIDRNGTHVAALLHDPDLLDQPQLLDAVAAVASIALENARLQVELRARLEELKGSRARIVEAGDSERRRLERNLHDGAQQRLVAVALQLRLLQNRIDDPETAAELVKAARDELGRSLDELRELARGLHPAVLEHGLHAALNALATRASVATSVTYEADVELSQPVELAAYFVASEALTNVAKYADATMATVRVWRDNGSAMIEIADDGIGGADDTRGSGLRGLADRVEALEGSLRVVSPAGAGTVVTAKLPCGS